MYFEDWILGVGHDLLKFVDVISVVNNVLTPDPSTQVRRQLCYNLEERVRFILRGLVVSSDSWRLRSVLAVAVKIVFPIQTRVLRVIIILYLVGVY